MSYNNLGITIKKVSNQKPSLWISSTRKILFFYVLISVDFEKLIFAFNIDKSTLSFFPEVLCVRLEKTIVSSFSQRTCTHAAADGDGSFLPLCPS